MHQKLFTHNQQVALALLPKFSGLLSICASVWIVVEVLKEPSKRSNVYHRLLCGMSLWDGIVSASMFLSTWPMPTGGDDEDNTVWYVVCVRCVVLCARTHTSIYRFLSFSDHLVFFPQGQLGMSSRVLFKEHLCNSALHHRFVRFLAYFGFRSTTF